MGVFISSLITSSLVVAYKGIEKSKPCVLSSVFSFKVSAVGLSAAAVLLYLIMLLRNSRLDPETTCATLLFNGVA